MNDINLKPCPFCGVKPRLYWEAWKDISPDAGIWKLEADHKADCYITHINGTNYTGRSSSGSVSRLAEWWNHRENEDSNTESVSKAVIGLVDRFEQILRDIRESKVDDSVCGMCEYDGAFLGQSGDWCNECPGFEKDDCFKLSDECRERWVSSAVKEKK